MEKGKRKSTRQQHAKKGRQRSHLDTHMSCDGRTKGSKALQSVPPRASFFKIFLDFFKTHRPRASPTPPGRLPSAPAGPFLASKPTKNCRELMQNITAAGALLIILGLVIERQKNPMTTYTHTHKQTRPHVHAYAHTHTLAHILAHTDTHTHSHLL